MSSGLGPLHLMIVQDALKAGVNPALALSVAEQESSLSPGSVGDNGQGLGLFQLHAGAATDAGIPPARRMEPALNSLGGTRYLRQKLDQSGGDVAQALQRYNGGSDPQYVTHVLRHYPRYASLLSALSPASAEAAEPTAQAAKPSPSDPEALNQYLFRDRQGAPAPETKPSPSDPEALNQYLFRQSQAPAPAAAPTLPAVAPGVRPLPPPPWSPAPPAPPQTPSVPPPMPVLKPSGSASAPAQTPPPVVASPATPVGIPVPGLELEGNLLDDRSQIAGQGAGTPEQLAQAAKSTAGEAINAAGTAGGAALGGMVGWPNLGAGLGGYGARKLNQALGFAPAPGSALAPLGIKIPLDWGDVATLAGPAALDYGVIRPLAKVVNAVQGIMGNPAAVARLRTAQGLGIEPSYTDVVGRKDAPVAGRLETLGENLLGSGTLAFRKGEQAQAQAGMTNLVQQRASVVGQTPYTAEPLVQQLASKGDPEALYTLRLAREAGSNPGAVIKASAKMQEVALKQQGEALYAQRDALAQQLGTRLDAGATLAQAHAALDIAHDFDVPAATRQLNAIIERLTPTTAPHPTLPGILPDVTQTPPVSFQDLAAMRSRLTTAINKTNAQPLEQELMGQVKQAIQADMQRAVEASQQPALMQAQQAADAHWATRVVPQRDFVQSLQDVRPDQVIKQFFKPGQGDLAQAAYQALDAKGQAAARSAFLEQVMTEGSQPAIHPGTGMFSPVKFAANMERNRAAVEHFFPPGSPEEIQGVVNLMRHLERAGQYAEDPATGLRGANLGRLMEPLASIGGGLFAGGADIPRALGGIAGTYVGGAVVGQAIRAMTMTPIGRDFLLASSQLAPGSPLMQSLLMGAIRQIPQLGTALVQQSMQPRPDAPTGTSGMALGIQPPATGYQSPDLERLGVPRRP